MRYTISEWIEKETQSYGEYIEQMSGTELLEEYRLQGGEEPAYFDLEREEIVVEEEIGPCPKCSSTMLGNTEHTPKGLTESDSWCPGCGYTASQLMKPSGCGAGDEGQLSPEDLQRRRVERGLNRGRSAEDGPSSANQ